MVTERIQAFTKERQPKAADSGRARSPMLTVTSVTPDDFHIRHFNGCPLLDRNALWAELPHGDSCALTPVAGTLHGVLSKGDSLISVRAPK
jgi:hypothetical protein